MYFYLYYHQPTLLKRKLHLEKWAELLTNGHRSSRLASPGFTLTFPSQTLHYPACFAHCSQCAPVWLRKKAWNETLMLYCFEKIYSCLFWEKILKLFFYWTVTLVWALHNLVRPLLETDNIKHCLPQSVSKGPLLLAFHFRTVAVKWMSFVAENLGSDPVFHWLAMSLWALASYTDRKELWGLRSCLYKVAGGK